MKITREIINGLDIDKYANDLLSFGRKAYLEYSNKERTEIEFIKLTLDQEEKKELFSQNKISECRYNFYLKASANRRNEYLKYYKLTADFINENKDILIFIITGKMNEDQKLKETLGDINRFYNDEKVRHYTILYCNKISNIINDIDKISEYNLYIYNSNTQTIADDLERIKVVNKNIEATRIQEIENKDFQTLTFILNNQFNHFFYTLGDEYRQTVVSELIDLTVYKYLVDNNVQDLTTEKTVNIREKLLIAKDLGLFENEKYSKDPRKKNVISNSEFARQFAKIAGCSSHRVRAVYSQMRNNDEL